MTDCAFCKNRHNDYAVPVAALTLGPADALPLSSPTHTAHVDTGASALVLPAAAFARFQELLVAAETSATAPAAPPPPLFITIGGSTYEVPLAEYTTAAGNLAVVTDPAQPEYFVRPVAPPCICAHSPRPRP